MTSCAAHAVIADALADPVAADPLEIAAKGAKTRKRRVEKCRAKVLRGKGFNER